MPSPSRVLRIVDGVPVYDTHQVDGSGDSAVEARAAFDRSVAWLAEHGFELAAAGEPRAWTARAGRGRSFRHHFGFGEWWPIRERGRR